MRQHLVVSAIAAALVISAAQSAEAQRRRGLVEIVPNNERHGFWVNLGLGAGTESSKLDGTDDRYTDGLTKPSYSLRVGGTINPNVRLGAELSGWADTHNDAQGERVTDYLGGLMLIGQFYPSRRAGFFLKGGLGVSRSGESFDGGGGFHEDGFGFTAGAGYEIKVSRSLFITPTVDWLQHQSRVRDEFGVLQPTFHDRLITVGVALTIQPGR